MMKNKDNIILTAIFVVSVFLIIWLLSALDDASDRKLERRNEAEKKRLRAFSCGIKEVKDIGGDPHYFLNDGGVWKNYYNEWELIARGENKYGMRVDDE